MDVVLLVVEDSLMEYSDKFHELVKVITQMKGNSSRGRLPSNI